MSVTPVIGASTTGLSIRTGPIWMGARVRINCLKKRQNIGSNVASGKPGANGRARAYHSLPAGCGDAATAETG